MFLLSDLLKTMGFQFISFLNKTYFLLIIMMKYINYIL